MKRLGLQFTEEFTSDEGRSVLDNIVVALSSEYIRALVLLNLRFNMNELQRQAYLDVMGIQTYFPRIVLAGAKPSPVYDFPIEQLAEPDPKTNGRVRIDRETPKEKVRHQRSRPSEPSIEKPTIESKVESKAGVRSEQSEKREVTGLEQADKSPPLEEQDKLKFSLRYIKINEQLAIIDEVPHQKSERLTREDLALLTAILTALCVDYADSEFKPESFSWPLAAQLSMKNDPAEEAKRALSGFIQMRHDTDKFSNLLVFAGQIDSLLVRQENELELRDFQAKGSNYFFTITRSLNSMLAYPSLKRDVWQHLQPLRKRLLEI
ncbi:MAG: hypothetical protein COA96_01950 [SAR86 cluster bacterium]|uniref:Uncharacterized protein n=1 Tax=SAR86 cluster bacterium TaxID=2030880 RepID=A0A2A5B9A5_9GAMM|nr:MAG: hypothetical protein COA96_01950 [SAR86 cluster bacterium]